MLFVMALVGSSDAHPPTPPIIAPAAAKPAPTAFTDSASGDDAYGCTHNRADCRTYIAFLGSFLENIPDLVANDFKSKGPLLVENDLNRQHAGSQNIKTKHLCGFIGIGECLGGNQLCCAGKFSDPVKVRKLHGKGSPALSGRPYRG